MALRCMYACCDCCVHFSLVFAGKTPSQLSPMQLLQIIDCIEGFLKVRLNAVGSLSLTAQENRPGNVLRETRRDMIAKYVDVMAPKLRSITDNVLNTLLTKNTTLVSKADTCMNLPCCSRCALSLPPALGRAVHP